jgi:hypothetical protein
MSLAAGTRIGPYEILASLGAGGMGEVYHARDPRLERAVAIKILTPSRQATPVELERFQREARAIARITNPYICTIHDVGQQDSVAFLVMELLDGETLADRLERGLVPLDRALVIAAQIAEALDAAHSKQVIHRDLKPSNVMLTASGVKLLDFGLAKFRDAEYEDSAQKPTKSLQLTDQGSVLGTLPYMAPEQVDGRGADARTDIFALGVVLYEMTTRRKPFEGKTSASLAAAILVHDPPPVSSLAAASPASLDRIVKKCLAKDPDERWQSARDLASALQWSTADTSQPIAARPRNASRRRRRTTIGVATAAGAALGALAFWSLSGDRLDRAAAAPDHRFTPVTFRTGIVSAARFAPDGDTVVYSAAWGAEPYALFMTRRGSVESRPLNVPDAKLLGVSSTGELAFLRGRHAALKLLGPAESGTLTRVSIAGGGPREILDDVVAADWKAGSADLAVVRRAQVEFPLGTKIHDGPHGFSYVRIAPDGQRLALVEGSDIVVLDQSGRKTTLSTGWGDLTTLAWSSTGDEVWFTASRLNDLTTWALRAVSLTGKERVILPSPAVLLRILDVFPDGRALLSSQIAKMGCSCLPPGDTQQRELAWLDGSAPEALSADGRTVLLAEMLRGGGTGAAIYLRKTDGSEAVRLGNGFPEDLSSDGKWVLATPPGNRQHWVIMPTGPGSSRTLPSGPIVSRFEANFLPNGRQIVFGGLEKGHGPRIYLQDVDGASLRAISPENVQTTGLSTIDGRYVVGWSAGRFSLYAVDGGAPVALPFLSSGDLPLQWSADGRLVYVQRTATWPPAVDRVDLTTGRRELWKTIQPADPVGVDSVFRIVVTPGGKAYCHDYVRFLSELFVVEGLK